MKKFIAFRKISDRTKKKLQTRKSKIVLGIIEAETHDAAYNIASVIDICQGISISICPFNKAWENQKKEAEQIGIIA